MGARGGKWARYSLRAKPYTPNSSNQRQGQFRQHSITLPHGRQPRRGGNRLTNQWMKGLAKTIRAMADGTLDSQVGARICNGLGIMRACLETQKLEQLEARMDEIAGGVAQRCAARERTSTYEAQRPSY
jgi:hypothetical protein